MPRRGVLLLWAAAVFLLGAGASSVRAQEATPPQEKSAAEAPAKASADTAAGTGADTAAGAPAVPGADTAAAPTAAAAVSRARAAVETPWHARALSAFGLVALVGMAWLLSVDRRSIPWRVIVWGMGLQFVFALFILRTPVGETIFAAINDVIVSLLGFTTDGARFLFGNLVSNNVPVGSGDALGNTFTATPGLVAQTGAFFAFNVLPTIIFFSSLMTVLYHLGVMQMVVRGIAWVMMRTMRTSGAETLSAAGNIFVGQTEAPLMIKPFVGTLTMSELMAVMVGGFATVAGGVMAAYVGMLVGYFPDIAGHLLAASVMSAPAALAIAKTMFPEKGDPMTRGKLRVDIESPDANVIDAAARGAAEGLTLALNVGAMLLAFIALIAMINSLLGWIGDAVGLTALLRDAGAIGEGQRFTLEVLLGWLLAPLAWLMGVPWKDAVEVGALLGIKTVANEFLAYLQLSTMLGGGTDLSPRSIIIATYALCGFANFSSIAIQIGGIGGIAPARRSDLARLGLRAMIGGTLAAFMTATVAGIII
jgi:CNT family concentrative nucleoside transporter